MLPINDAELPSPQRVDVRFNLEELWLIQTLVRQHQQSGFVWNRDDMRQVHKGITELTALSPEQRASASYAIHADLSLLWLIEAQVPSTAMMGSSYIGRDILNKVFAALGHFEAPADVALPDELEALLLRLEEGHNGSTSQDADHASLA